MLKLRVTFVDNNKGNDELENLLLVLHREFEVLNQSNIYKGRGGSQYSNIYIDIDREE